MKKHLDDLNQALTALLYNVDWQYENVTEGENNVHELQTLCLQLHVTYVLDFILKQHVKLFNVIEKRAMNSWFNSMCIDKSFLYSLCFMF